MCHLNFRLVDRLFRGRCNIIVNIIIFAVDLQAARMQQRKPSVPDKLRHDFGS